MAIKRIPVCFNLENESQQELYEMCERKFGKNFSGGIRQILFAYFNNNTPNVQPTFPTINREEEVDLSTVL
jgi:hypothetical protein